MEMQNEETKLCETGLHVTVTVHRRSASAMDLSFYWISYWYYDTHIIEDANWLEGRLTDSCLIGRGRTMPSVGT